MKIVQLDTDLCEDYKNEISNYIYLSMNRGCKEECFTRDASFSKAEELKLYLSEGKAYAFIALDSTVEGFLWAYPYGNDKEIYLSIIYVDDRNRGKHIGKSLIEVLEVEAKKNGYQKIWLHTDANNSTSRQFYSRQGYLEERVQLSKKL